MPTASGVPTTPSLPTIATSTLLPSRVRTTREAIPEFRKYANSIFSPGSCRIRCWASSTNSRCGLKDMYSRSGITCRMTFLIGLPSRSVREMPNAEGLSGLPFFLTPKVSATKAPKMGTEELWDSACRLLIAREIVCSTADGGVLLQAQGAIVLLNHAVAFAGGILQTFPVHNSNRPAHILDQTFSLQETGCQAHRGAPGPSHRGQKIVGDG